MIGEGSIMTRAAIIARHSLSAAAALRLAQLACDYAESRGWSIAVCVVDAQGTVLACLRMDAAAPAILDYAGDKAFSAATMRRPTRDIFAHLEASPRLLAGAVGRPRLLLWGGGLPIQHEGQTIGAIGVSGAEEDEDIDCARTALAALGMC